MKSKVTTVRVGDLCEQIRGVSYGKADASNEAVLGLVPILRANNITDSGVTYDNLVYVPASCVSPRQKLKKNDILVAASSGSIKVVGKTAQCTKNFDGAFGAFCKVLRPNDKVAPGYFSHYFQTPSYRHTISNLAAGANINNLKNEHLNDLKIPLPPLDEQRRIAAILDKADAIRRKRRKAIRLLDDFLRATFLDMFGDPVTNPKGWNVRKLSEFYINPKEGTKCGPFGSALKKGELVESGVAVWNMDNIGEMGEMILPFRMWITSGKYQELESYSVVDGDILISRAGTVGKMCVASMNGQPGIISTNLIRLRLGSTLLPIYFVSLMLYCGARIGRLRTGSDGAFTHMNTSILDSLEFPYPPPAIQNRYADIVQTIERQKETLVCHSSESESLFSSLQSRAFKGEL